MADEETAVDETTSEETTAVIETEGAEKPGKVDDADRKTWESEARKHERRAKKADAELAAAQAKLKELEQAGASENEKAIAKAREEEAAKVRSEFESERRADRLEVSVTRLAASGIAIKDGDDTKTVRFADPDDALVNLERAVAKGDVSADDIFDTEGKVQTDALKTALADLLERKPHLKAPDGTAPVRPNGSADGGRGSGAGKGAEDMSIDEHFKAIQRTK